MHSHYHNGHSDQSRRVAGRANDNFGTILEYLVSHGRVDGVGCGEGGGGAGGAEAVGGGRTLPGTNHLIALMTRAVIEIWFGTDWLVSWRWMCVCVCVLANFGPPRAMLGSACYLHCFIT